MALFHFSVTQSRRSAGQSVIASAAYRAGEKLYSEYYGETNDYTRKAGVIHTEILLPPHAPDIYHARATLWNAVENLKSINQEYHLSSTAHTAAESPPAWQQYVFARQRVGAEIGTA